MRSYIYICNIQIIIMKPLFQIGVFSVFALVSCKSAYDVTSVHPEENTYITNQLKEDSNLNALIAPYKAELEGKMNTQISHTNIELNKKGDNSNLGNLLADYTFEGADEWCAKNNFPPIDAAVINIGGIRSIIGAGPITTKQVYEVMPFENEVVIVKIKGKDVQGLFDYYAKTQKNNPVSHLVIETDQDAISKQLINGEALKPERDYYIATSDYLALGGDNMKFFSKGEMIETGIKMRDLFMEKFKSQPEVSVPDDVRLIFKNKKSEINE